jgi:hypothetical protein
MLIIIDQPKLLGQNFGFMQLTPPIPKTIKPVKKKPKRGRPRTVKKPKKRK